MSDDAAIDEVMWSRVAAFLVKKAHLLVETGDLRLPITITVDGEEGTVFEIQLPTLDGILEIGEAYPVKLQGALRFPVYIEITDGQIAYRSKLSPEPLILQ